MFHKCYLLPSFKDIASFCFMHSLKILLLLLWVRSGCVFTLPFCMHAAQTGRSVQCVIRVERVWDAAVRDGERARQAKWRGPAGGTVWDGEGRFTGAGKGQVGLCRVRVLRLHPTPIGISPRGPWGSLNHLCNSCHSTSCKEFYYFVHFIKKKKLFLQTTRVAGWLFSSPGCCHRAGVLQSCAPRARWAMEVQQGLWVVFELEELQGRDGLSDGNCAALAAVGVRVLVSLSQQKQRHWQNGGLQAKVCSVCRSGPRLQPDVAIAGC